MAIKKVYNIIRFVSGYPQKQQRNEYGKLQSISLLDKTLGLQLDGFFHYDNPDEKYPYIQMHNLKGPLTFYQGIPADAPESLKIKFLDAMRVYLQTKGDPNWFKCRFVRVIVSRFPKFDRSSRSYDEELFAILARNSIHYLDSSNTVIKELYRPSQMIIAEEFEEGEFPNGTCYLSDFFHSLHNDLESEKMQYLQYKKLFPDLR